MANERFFRTIKISERLPDMGKRVMFLNENYQGEFMIEYHAKETIEIKKNKFIQMMDCHFVTDFLQKNYTHWLEEITLAELLNNTATDIKLEILQPTLSQIENLQSLKKSSALTNQSHNTPTP